MEPHLDLETLNNNFDIFVYNLILCMNLGLENLGLGNMHANMIMNRGTFV